MNNCEKLDEERRVARAAIRHMNAIGANRRPVTMIVFDMAVSPGKPYKDSLLDWAAYEDEPMWTAHRWHTEICFWLLKDGQEVPDGVAAWFEEQAREVRRLADGVSA